MPHADFYATALISCFRGENHPYIFFQANYITFRRIPLIFAKYMEYLGVFLFADYESEILFPKLNMSDPNIFGYVNKLNG